MAVKYSEKTGEFHLYNQQLSYILQILPNGEMGNLYFGKKIRHKEDFSYLLEGRMRSLTVYPVEGNSVFSPECSRMEYPCTGTGDFREPAFELRQENGSRITHFQYCSHRIYKGKENLPGLPALYVEQDCEADSLEITLMDEVLQAECILRYSIFNEASAITRSVSFRNLGQERIVLERVMSASVDLADMEYEMIQLSGAWARERHVITRGVNPGIQGAGSRRGISSAEQNPFLALKRPKTDETRGEAYGFSLIYSGNHMEQVEADTFGMTRVQIGIHPDGFEWQLKPGEHFQSPEAVLVYSEDGLGGMSRTFHKLYRTRLVRGVWRDRERPVLINNWEATGVDFTEQKLLEIAEEGKALGMELFVLDDGWFGNREDDSTGLGDWYVKNWKKLPDGIKGLGEKINGLGLQFGLWFEPEMVNQDSDLYRAHPDWILCPPGRTPSPSRNQYLLDFSRKEVVDAIYEMMEKILSEAPVGYVKWDMNRYMTECYSVTKEPEAQGKVMHQYILGVYELYERLIQRFPEILFESCSSGGARFDPGMLYYAPQTWTSDDTDAMERLKIQYGTSFVYPLSAMDAHVSEVPNQQVGRVTPFETRANVAMFGIFGYELDLTKLTADEKELVRAQIAFTKRHRRLIMTGEFYRLISPFEKNDAAWMVVSEDRIEALAGFYRMNGIPNGGYIRLKLAGLDSEKNYILNFDDSVIYGGDELMNAGMVIEESRLTNFGGDSSSGIYYLKEAGGFE